MDAIMYKTKPPIGIKIIGATFGLISWMPSFPKHHEAVRRAVR